MYTLLFLAATALASRLSKTAAMRKTISDDVDRSDWCQYGCDPTWIGDGICDSPCNNDECGQDDGDCGECADWCFNSWVGDGECDVDCFNEDCDMDGGDCDFVEGRDCAPGCEIAFIGDGQCQSMCENDDCDNDLGDCEEDKFF